jgi:hypothetical protein
MRATRAMLVDRGFAAGIPDFEEFWESFARFQRYQHAHGRSVKEIMSPKRAFLAYDIAAWLEAGMPRDPSPYKLYEPQEFEFRLSEEGARGLGGALETWGAQLKGLTKMMKRIRVIWQVRECVAVRAAMRAVGMGV